MVTKAGYYLIEVVTKAGYYLIEVVTKAGYYLMKVILSVPNEGYFECTL